MLLSHDKNGWLWLETWATRLAMSKSKGKDNTKYFKSAFCNSLSFSANWTLYLTASCGVMLHGQSPWCNTAHFRGSYFLFVFFFQKLKLLFQGSQITLQSINSVVVNLLKTFGVQVCEI
jgi:hypothetical protein